MHKKCLSERVSSSIARQYIEPIHLFTCVSGCAYHHHRLGKKPLDKSIRTWLKWPVRRPPPFPSLIFFFFGNPTHPRVTSAGGGGAPPTQLNPGVGTQQLGRKVPTSAMGGETIPLRQIGKEQPKKVEKRRCSKYEDGDNYIFCFHML